MSSVSIVKLVKVIYAFVRIGDDLDIGFLHAMITKGIVEPVSDTFVNLFNVYFIAKQRGLIII